MQPATADAVIGALRILDPGRRDPHLADYGVYLHWVLTTLPWSYDPRVSYTPRQQYTVTGQFARQGLSWRKIAYGVEMTPLAGFLHVGEFRQPPTRAFSDDTLVLIFDLWIDESFVGTYRQAREYAAQYGAASLTDVAELLGLPSPIEVEAYANTTKLSPRQQRSHSGWGRLAENIKVGHRARRCAQDELLEMIDRVRDQLVFSDRGPGWKVVVDLTDQPVREVHPAPAVGIYPNPYKFSAPRGFSPPSASARDHFREAVRYFWHRLPKAMIDVYGSDEHLLFQYRQRVDRCIRGEFRDFPGLPGLPKTL